MSFRIPGQSFNRNIDYPNHDLLEGKEKSFKHRDLTKALGPEKGDRPKPQLNGPASIRGSQSLIDNHGVSPNEFETPTIDGLNLAPTVQEVTPGLGQAMIDHPELSTHDIMELLSDPDTAGLLSTDYHRPENGLFSGDLSQAFVSPKESDSQ